MTRDVTITVIGIQSDESGQEFTTELTVQGQYFEKNHCHYILYEEKDSDTGAITKNTLKIKDSQMELTKSDLFRSQMLFQPGETHRTSYMTSYGSLQFDVHTESLKCFWTDNSGTIQAAYRLSTEGTMLSNNKLTIKIRNFS